VSTARHFKKTSQYPYKEKKKKFLQSEIEDYQKLLFHDSVKFFATKRFNRCTLFNNLPENYRMANRV